MRLLALALALTLGPKLALAGPAALVEAAVTEHILPRFAALAESAHELDLAADKDCAPDSPLLIEAYHSAFDAWMGVSHLRFGPTEVDNRGFALAFWPDLRGKASKALRKLVIEEDPIVTDPGEFARVSVAARGFYALERLLFDPEFTGSDKPAYVCQLVRAVAKDIDLVSDVLLEDWRSDFAQEMTQSGDIYPTHKAALRDLYKTLTSGLQYTAELRLGHPLGSATRPRPRRAEARLSQRSLSNVVLNLEALRELTAAVSQEHREIATSLDQLFADALAAAQDVSDPAFSNIEEPQERLYLEVLKQRIEAIRTAMQMDLGPALGVSSGFNALDGD